MKKLLPFLMIVSFALLAFVGCGENSFEPAENRPPETGLAITGQELAETIYRVELKWWGSDVDGEVNGYQYRWTPLDEGIETFDLDTKWTYTGFVKKEFLVPVTDSLAGYRFEVRAVDNLGAVDPEPAWQNYPFYNNPPWAEIRFIELLPDSAWPVLAFGWDAIDPDGDSTIAAHLIWVKGREDSPLEYAADIDTVLLLPADIDTSGDVTIFFQTIDEGHAASVADSFDIYLYEVKGDVLLVDDVTVSEGLGDCDRFYREFLADRVGEDGFTALDLRRAPFDTDIRFEGLLNAFDQVIWYTGSRFKFSADDTDDFNDFTQLMMAEMGIRSFIDQGGDFFISSLNAVGSFGGLTAGFFIDYIGVDTLYLNEFANTSFEFNPANVSGYTPCQVPFLAMEGTGLSDLYLKCPIQYAGIDSPDPRTPTFRAEKLYMVPDNIFKEQPGTFYPMVRYDVPDPSGKVILCTFPVSLYYGGENGEENWVGNFNTLLDWFSSP